MTNAEEYIKIAADAAVTAGEAIMEIYGQPETEWDTAFKADNSPLTKADTASHRIIAAALSKTGIPVLSEEAAAAPYQERASWKRLWIVDPLDGTKEFIKRNGEFTVNIALVENGVPTAGAIYVPVSKVLYWGTAEGGAYRQILSSHSSAEKLPLPQDGRPFTVVASRSHLSAETAEYIDNIRRMHRDVSIISAGSSLKLCLIAEGRADIYPRFAPTCEWDTAAGHAIVKAAGREVYCTDEKTPLSYNKENIKNPWFIAK